MPFKAAKKTLDVTSDGEVSDRSAVCVSTGIVPKHRSDKRIQYFGTVESDDEVVVVEKKRKPSQGQSSSPTKVRVTGSSSSPKKIAAHVATAGGRDDDDDSDSSVASIKTIATPRKQAYLRNAQFGTIKSDPDEIDMVVSPVVKDLTAGSSKRVSHDAPTRRKGADNNVVDTPLRRTPRVPKPSVKAQYMEPTTPATSLAAKLDSLGRVDSVAPSPDGVSDDSYRPALSSRKTGNAPSKGKSRARPSHGLNPAVNGTQYVDEAPVSPMQDVQLSSMHSPGSDTGSRLPEFRPLTDSEDELPSPTTAVKPKALRVQVRLDESDSDVHDDGSDVPCSPSRASSKGNLHSAPSKIPSSRRGNRQSIAERQSVEWDERALAKLSSPTEDTYDSLLVQTGVDQRETKHVSTESTNPRRRRDTISLTSASTIEGGRTEHRSLDNNIQHDSRRRHNLLESDDEDDDASQNVESASTVQRRPLLDPDLIHHRLRDMYDGLSWLDDLLPREFCGYSRNLGSFSDFTPLGFGAVYDAIPATVRSKLMRSMGFVSSPPVYNPVRVPLSNFTVGWDCIRSPLADGRFNAVFVLPGICTASYIAEGVLAGQDLVKQVHLQPFENDFAILQSNIGGFFNATLMHAPGRRNALIYQTKKKGWTPPQFQRYGPSSDTSMLGSTPYNSPSKGSSNKADIDYSPAEGAFRGSVLRANSSAYRLFEEGIPVYDGRTTPAGKGFRFRPQDWETYTSLPRYPYAEIAPRALIVVAHTVSGFKKEDAQYHTVHFNALFVIVLGDIEIPN